MKQNRKFVREELEQSVKQLGGIIDQSILKSNLNEDIIWRILLLGKWQLAFNIHF